LPVANYMSTISVAKDGAGSTLTWSGKYDAKGASDADAKKTMDGVYQAGVDVLVK
jgi:Polyketide cyclase / dehydrase and lipid transport